MLTYDVRVLMMPEDDLRRVLGVLRGCSGLPANQKIENKIPDVFFQGEFDCHAPGRRNIIQKLKNKETHSS